MESFFNFSYNEIVAFALVLLRMIGFIVAMPVIGSSNVPAPTKVLLALTLTFILFPTINHSKLEADINSLAIITIGVKEVFIGLTFGFIARLFFMAVSMAAHIMSVSMGVASAQLFDPSMGEVSTALDQFYIYLASLFFLTINGHHLLISGIFELYSIVPISKTLISLSGFQDFGVTVQKIMAAALKMSAPILVSIFFMNVAVALIGRAVPQINILITSLPVNVLVGFVVLFIGLPLLIWQLTQLLDLTSMELLRIIKSY